MNPASQEMLTRATADEISEILKIARSIRDDIKLLPNKTADEIRDILKELELGVGLRSDRLEGQDNLGRLSPGGDDAPESEITSKKMDVINEVSNNLIDLNARLQEKRIEIEELSHSVELKRKDLDAIGSQKAMLEKNVADLEHAEQQARFQLADLKSMKESLSEKVGELRSMAELADTVRSLAEEKDKALARESQSLERCEELQKRNVVNQVFLDRLWPHWLRADEMGEWKMQIESEIAGDNSSAAAGLLFAALHSFSAALLDEDPKSLHDSLRDVGRRLYAWLRELGRSAEEASDIAEKWALSINQECRGSVEVEVPVPGHAANNQWMIFQPRGGSSPDVLSVRSWCVRDALKRPVHRAEVTV